MLAGLVSLAVANEIATTQLAAQAILDKYYWNGQEYTFTYDISTRGNVTADVEEFRQIVAETYADSRGWKRAGVTMKEVSTGGQLHVILASGDQVKAASPVVCSEKLSCRVGNLVLINDDRWQHATDSYNDEGIELIEYRKMVINHETGHYFGHDHTTTCEAKTGVAPVMLQQSTGARGCKLNTWPISSELWVKR